MGDLTCKLLILGAGPGGYVCAIRAGQLGVDTVVVEAATPGGTCLSIGCIPSKALIHAAGEFATLTLASRGLAVPGIRASAPGLDLTQVMGWKDGIVTKLTNGVSALLARAGVRMVQGEARFLNGKAVAVKTAEGEVMIHAETVVIATGSEPVSLPNLPFGGSVISSTEALALQVVPKQLVVVGGGYIGLELGTAFAKLGAKVTVVEAAQRVLPQYDQALTRPIVKNLKALGIEVLTGTKALGLQGAALKIEVAGEERLLPADKVLVTAGRRPRSGIAAPLALDMAGPFIAIDPRCRTSMTGVYAIGDVTGEPMLAHRAMAQGEMVADLVAGLPRRWDKRAIPAVCFTDPELVTVGLSPDQAGEETLIGEFPFAANGRALTLGGGEGFVRVVARADNHLILGFQAVGAGVGELATAFGLAVEAGLRLEDISGTIHAHPTLGEAVQEAALRALGHALHI